MAKTVRTPVPPKTARASDIFLVGMHAHACHVGNAMGRPSVASARREQWRARTFTPKWRRVETAYSAILKPRTWAGLSRPTGSWRKDIQDECWSMLKMCQTDLAGPFRCASPHCRPARPVYHTNSATNVLGVEDGWDGPVHSVCACVCMPIKYSTGVEVQANANVGLHQMLTSYHG